MLELACYNTSSLAVRGLGLGFRVSGLGWDRADIKVSSSLLFSVLFPTPQESEARTMRLKRRSSSRRASSSSSSSSSCSCSSSSSRGGWQGEVGGGERGKGRGRGGGGGGGGGGLAEFAPSSVNAASCRLGHEKQNACAPSPLRSLARVFWGSERREKGRFHLRLIQHAARSADNPIGANPKP